MSPGNPFILRSKGLRSRSQCLCQSSDTTQYCRWGFSALMPRAQASLHLLAAGFSPALVFAILRVPASSGFTVMLKCVGSGESGSCVRLAAAEDDGRVHPASSPAVHDSAAEDEPVAMDA